MRSSRRDIDPEPFDSPRRRRGPRDRRRFSFPTRATRPIAAALLALPALPIVAHATNAAAAPPSTTDPISQGIVAVIIVAVFALLALEKAHRLLIVLAAAAVLWGITYLTPYRLITFEATASVVDLNVLILLASMMALVGVLKSTGVFTWAVARLMERAAGRPTVIMRLVAWFTGAVSAVADNVTTVLFVTPMATGVARRLGVRPAAFLLPMVMAANIGGTATLIGDPPNILIGSGAGLTFMDFVINLTIPCVIMLIALEIFSERYYRHDLVAVADDSWREALGPAPVIENPVLLRWLLIISAGVFVGFVTHGFTGVPPAVPATVGAAAALVVQDVLYLRKHRPSQEERVHGLIKIIEREIEWPTLSFFGFLFIVVGAAVQTGLIQTIADGLLWAIGAGRDAFALSPAATLLFAALIILWASGFLSALIDNIPFVAVSIPIVAQLNGSLAGDSRVLWWSLALGACLGGNGSPVGASANVTTIGLAERDGVRLGFREFMRFGAIVAAGTLVISSGFLVLHVYLGQWGAFWAGAAVLAAVAVARALWLRVVRRDEPALLRPPPDDVAALPRERTPVRL